MRVELAVLLVSVALGAVGQVILKYAVNGMGEINLGWPQVVNTLLRIFTNGWIVLGVFCFVTSMVLWIKVISNMELSKAYPSVSLSYIIVFVLSVVLFKENVTVMKTAGIVLVSMGVYFLQR